MEQNTVNNETLEQSATSGDTLKTPGLLENAQALWRELREFGHDYFHLVALEARRAGQNLVYMIIAGVVAAALLIGVWLGLVAAAILWLTEHGFMASTALLFAVGFNLLLALILVLVIKIKSRYLQFPATVRCLQPMPSPQRHNKKES